MKLPFTKSKTKEIAKYIAVNTHQNKSIFETVYKEDETLIINKKKQNIEVFEDSDGFTYIKLQNKKYAVEIIEQNQNKYHVLINGVSYFFSVETPISFKRQKFLKKNQPVSKIEQVLAPMPGKILDIMSSENEAIQDGEAILILEAMKMQNEIISHVTGKITKVFVKTGDNVMKDDILVEIHK